MTVVATAMIDLPSDDTPIPVAAEMYAALGFRVIPLHGVVDGRCTCGHSGCDPRNAGKHPLGRGWGDIDPSDTDAVRSLFRHHRWNIAIMLGSKHLAIDVDGPGGYESLKKLGPMPDTLTAQSGSLQGEHRIFAYAPHQDPEAITNRAVLPKLDIKTRSGQLTLAPSIHRSGNRYRWTNRIMPAVLPDSLYNLLLPARQAPVIQMIPRSTGDMYERASRYVAQIDPAISGSGGHAQTFAAARAIMGWVAKGLPPASGWALLVDYNNRCQPPWTERELSHKWQQAQKAHSIPEFEDRSYRSEPVRTFEEPDEPEPEVVPEVEPKPEPKPVDYRARMLWVVDKQGRTKAVKHIENIICILRYHPEWVGKVRLDEHAQVVTVTNPPWRESHAPSTSTAGTVIWSDTDSSRLAAWLRRERDIELDVTTADCDKAVDIVAHSSPYHPVRDWMAGLIWDGTPRLADAPAIYLGADSDSYTKSVFRWWMISAVARTFDPGCKADHVLILEGPQGLRKSSALRALASPEWFTDTPLDLHSKDAYISLCGKLVVELAELESLRRADASRAKSFFTSSIDSFRRPYDRRMVTVKRSCVFAGTVNDASYLQDQTGNRRYWPIRCTQIDLDLIVRDRDQMWAEAVAAYRDGARWWPDTTEEVAVCEQQQEVRVHVDEWESLIASWLARHTDGEYTIGGILKDVIGIPPDKWTRADQMRVAVCMQRLGHVRRQRRDGGRREWRYLSPNHPLIRGAGDR